MAVSTSKIIPQVGFWTALSDDELLSRRFDVENPEGLSDLIALIPNTSETPSVEYKYHTPGSKAGYVYCAHCRFQSHNRGFVLRYSDGRRVLVGKDCAKKHYGVSFEVAHNEFRQAHNRASALIKKNLVAENKLSLLALVDELQSHPTVKQFETLHRNFNRLVAGCTKDLHFAVTKDSGQLWIEERIRDHAAEIERDERLDARREEAKLLSKTERNKLLKQGSITSTVRSRKPIYKLSRKIIGRLSGNTFCIPERRPSERLFDLANRTRAAFQQIEAESRTSELVRLLRAFDNVLAQITSEIERLASPIQFFTHRNLELVRAFLAPRLPQEDKISIGPMSISRFEASVEAEIFCELPSTYSAPSGNMIEETRRKISMSR